MLQLVDDNRKALEALFRRHGVRRLELFGSRKYLHDVLQAGRNQRTEGKSLLAVIPGGSRDDWMVTDATR